MFRTAFIFILFYVLGFQSTAHAGLGYTKQSIRELVKAEAERTNAVPVAIALAVARVESNFNEGAESHVGARGVMQIMPRTAQGTLNVDPDDLWDPSVNIEAGLRYLAQLYQHYGYRWDAALSHYNGGTLKGNPYSAEPHGYTQDYVRKVMKYAREYERELTAEKLIAATHTVIAAPKEAPILRPWRERVGELETYNSLGRNATFDATKPPPPGSELVQWTKSLRQSFRQRLASHERTWLTRGIYE